MKGFFITVEGMDGCGKTTQIDKIVKYLEQKGKDIVTIREPGGTNTGEKIREILLDVNNKGMNEITELMLYCAARAELVDKIIIPALNEGKIVICDRFLDSSIVYQGFGRNLGKETVEKINYYAIKQCIPNLTFFFDISPEEIMLRKNRLVYKDRIEAEHIEFHKRVYKGYLDISFCYKDRIKSIDASKSIEEVFSDVKIYLDSYVLKEKEEIL